MGPHSLDAIAALPRVNVARRGAGRHLGAAGQRGQRQQRLVGLDAGRPAKQALLFGFFGHVPKVNVLDAAGDEGGVVPEAGGEHLVFVAFVAVNLGAGLPVPHCHGVVVVLPDAGQLLAVGRKGAVQHGPAVKAANDDFGVHERRPGRAVPHTQARVFAQFAGGHILAARVQRHAHDVVLVVDAKPLLVVLRVVHDAQARGVVHDFAVSVVAEVVAGVLGAVSVHPLQGEVDVGRRRVGARHDRRHGAEDGAQPRLDGHELVPAGVVFHGKLHVDLRVVGGFLAGATVPLDALQLQL